jgi:hypothetical protein
VQHDPPSSILCSKLPPKRTGFTYDFEINENRWNIDTPVDLLQGMKIAPGNKTAPCVLFQNEEPLAVLLMESPTIFKARICSFTPSKIDQASCGEYEGRSLYEWAVVAEKIGDNLLSTMKTTMGDISYNTDYFGPILSGSLKLVLKRQGVVCASLEEPKWKCRIGPGIDPAMFVCFLACIDKFRVARERNLKLTVSKPTTVLRKRRRITTSCKSRRATRNKRLHFGMRTCLDLVLQSSASMVPNSKPRMGLCSLFLSPLLTN